MLSRSAYNKVLIIKSMVSTTVIFCSCTMTQWTAVSLHLSLIPSIQQMKDMMSTDTPWKCLMLLVITVPQSLKQVENLIMPTRGIISANSSMVDNINNTTVR